MFESRETMLRRFARFVQDKHSIPVNLEHYVELFLRQESEIEDESFNRYMHGVPCPKPSNFDLNFPRSHAITMVDQEEVEEQLERGSVPHLLIGKRGNCWSDRAELLLRKHNIRYRFEQISSPPHPNPENCPGAREDTRAIPTLLLDYDTENESGGPRHVREPLAWGIEEIEGWVELDKSLRDQVKRSDV